MLSCSSKEGGKSDIFFLCEDVVANNHADEGWVVHARRSL